MSFKAFLLLVNQNLCSQHGAKLYEVGLPAIAVLMINFCPLLEYVHMR